MSLDLQQLEFLCTTEAKELLALDLPADELAAQKFLRKRCTAEQAIAVIVLRQVRRRAVRGGKFPPELAEKLLATDTLLQQASSMRLARHVGGQLAAVAGGKPVLDLCCGLGADTMGLALAGADVVAYDTSDVALACARANAAAAGVADRCRFERADVTELALDAGAVVHIDPDRRGSGRRVVSLDDCDPPQAFLRKLVAETRVGAVKLSPMLHWREVGLWEGASLEYLSEGGVCRQLVIWWGLPDRVGTVRATVVTGEAAEPQAATLVAQRAEIRIGPLGTYLVEPDAAVIAAHATDDLAAAHGLWRIDPRLVWLFGDEPVDIPLARSYRILGEAPGRRKDIAKAVRDLGGGVVRVKPRGVRVNTDKMQKALRGKGDRTLVVFWYRLGEHLKALVAEPC